MTQQATPLEERMRKHTPGQVTWPEPLLHRNCNTCQYFDQSETAVAPKSARRGNGRCYMAKAMQRVDGVVFNGAQAIACPKYKGD